MITTGSCRRLEHDLDRDVGVALETARIAIGPAAVETT
jgi:hypothetical protein